jgi:hypothetical protein
MAAANDSGGHADEVPTARRSRQPCGRPRRVEFSLTDEEFGELGAAAARAGLARGAYAAEAALSVARGVTSSADSAFREALGEFVRAAGLVQRIGVNLNQAVAKLTATGQSSGELLPYAPRASAGRNGSMPQRSKSVSGSGDREDQ